MGATRLGTLPFACAIRRKPAHRRVGEIAVQAANVRFLNEKAMQLIPGGTYA